MFAVVVVIISLHLIMMTIIITIASCAMIDLRKNSFNNNTKTKLIFDERDSATKKREQRQKQHSANSMNS